MKRKSAGRYALFVVFPALMMAAVLLPEAAHPALKTETIAYKDGEAALEGYLAYDDAVQGKRPGILVVHEWWGNNDYVRKRAEQLARLGYVAFALDMFGKGKATTDPKVAAELAGIYRKDRKLMRTRADAGLRILRGHPLVEGSKIAAIGYCFGGTVALEMARAGTDMAGAVSFHGVLDTTMPAGPGDIKAKVLVLHGADDSFAPPAQVMAFEDEMRKAGADWQLHTFGGSVHGFTNPAADGTLPGLAYNARADKRSWEEMRLFFAEIFK